MLAPGISALWPRISMTRDALTAYQLTRYVTLSDRLRNADRDMDEPDRGEEILKVLRLGGTEYNGFPITKGLAELALSLHHRTRPEQASADQGSPADR